MGVRASTPEMAARVRSAFARHLVDDRKAPPNLSLLEPGRGIWLVYRAGSVVARARSEAEALRVVAAELDAFAQPDQRPRVDAIVLTDGRRVVLAPTILRFDLARLSAALRRTRWRVTELPHADLGPDGRLVVPAPALKADESLLAPAALAPGVYPVAAWLDWRLGADQPLTDARRVAASAMTVLNVDAVGAQAALDAVAGAVQTAQHLSFADLDAREAVSALSSLG